ncbi:hypothetical protein D5086_010884 [Populus alba]|uniref:Uncharacterized protein n=1 Tax=Populus alba TaxID=43335 RepID=A0ACC4CAV5_POPAL
MSLLSVVNGGLDGCVDSLDNEESISGVALVNPSATTNQISGTSAFSTSVQGPVFVVIGVIDYGLLNVDAAILMC